MSTHPEFWPHGQIQNVFSDVYFVTGTMKTVLMGANWHFSRNMTIVRDGTSLTLINAVRLDDAGLAALDALGTVKNVVKIGSLHGHDDAFYVERYGATYWTMPGMPVPEGTTAKQLTPGGEVPFAGCSVFAFEHTKLPEGILRIDREGGILVACDSLQNWVTPDEFFSDESRQTMTGMGFFVTANIGPVWMQVNEPKGEDFARLKQLSFRHALCGHGQPLRDEAGERFSATFARLFGV